MGFDFDADGPPRVRIEGDREDHPRHPFLVQVDHIGIEVPDPAAVVRFFVDDLGLPEVFPLTAFPGYTTGSVALGNAYLEILRFGSPPRSRRAATSRYRILGFLAPSGALPGAALELDRRAISHSAVVPYYVPASMAGNAVVAWENVFVGDLIGGSIATRLFFAATRRLPSRPAAQHSLLATALTPPLLRRAFPTGMVVLTDYLLVNDDRKRANDRVALQARNGGELSVEAAAEVVVGATPGAAQAWRHLLDPVESVANNTWALGTGPALRLDWARPAGIDRLRLRVASIPYAERTLRRLGIPVTAAAGVLTFSPPGAAGVSIELTNGGH